MSASLSESGALGSVVIDVPIARALRKFPEHATIIGDLLLGYGQIEIYMVGAVELATSLSMDDSVRLLYRLRSAQSRLDIADAMIRPFFIRIDLKGLYGNWLGAMRRCKLIRNQYAHCDWDARPDEPWIADLEATATSPEGTAFIQYHPIKLDLLKEQRAYFNYAEDLIYYLWKEGAYRLDKRRRHKVTIPKSLPAPSLDSRPN